MQWHRLAQCHAKLVAQSDLSHFFTFQTFYSFGCQPHIVIALAQLTVVVGAPGVEGTTSGEYHCYPALGKLEVQHIEFVYTFNTVRSVKLSENTSAPDE